MYREGQVHKLTTVSPGWWDSRWYILFDLHFDLFEFIRRGCCRIWKTRGSFAALVQISLEFLFISLRWTFQTLILFSERCKAKQYSDRLAVPPCPLIKVGFVNWLSGSRIWNGVALPVMRARWWRGEGDGYTWQPASQTSGNLSDRHSKREAKLTFFKTFSQGRNYQPRGTFHPNSHFIWDTKWFLNSLIKIYKASK